MIIFVNGPFGAGKTIAAHILARRIPNAMVYDPEVIGNCIPHLVKDVEHANDYQDYALWPILTIEVARLLQETYRRSLIMPMTITRRDYYTVITNGFRRIDPALVCFRLVLSLEVLRARILASNDVVAVEWRLAHMEQGIDALKDPAFGVEVQTDDRSPEEVVEAILSTLLAQRQVLDNPSAV